MTTTHVRYFAAAEESAGCAEETVELASATVGALRALLVERYGASMQRVLDRGTVLIDGVAARDDAHPLGALADVLPPFSGG